MASKNQNDGPILSDGESETLLSRTEPVAPARYGARPPAPPPPPPSEERSGRSESGRSGSGRSGSGREPRDSRDSREPRDSQAQRAIPSPRRWVERFFESRSVPFVRLSVYYVILLAIMASLVYWIPMVRDAFVSPVVLPDLGRDVGASAITRAPTLGDYGARLSLNEALHRGITTLMVIAGALSLVVPVVWVYMFTKRFRYDPALVSSVVILPIVVAGIALVVKNSLALAFSLAGIVAAVRFRNTLKDPRDAVYIFLVIGIGLSAGVQALDVALAMSLAFNFVVLLVWKHNVGSIYSGSYGRTGILSVGDPELMIADDPVAQREIRQRMLEHDGD
ncbi:MAG TPA: DUF4956 domain-containing protein, partial [Longimicrobium sp.]